MIKFQLACTSGHEFEAWFGSGAAYDAQRGADLVACPICASIRVDKRPMAPAIVTSRAKSRRAASALRAVPDALASRPVVQSAPAADPELKMAIESLRQLKSELLANTEDVGQDFPEEARRMHFGEAPERSIRGAATLDEARALHEDGIDFGILPQLPDDQN